MKLNDEEKHKITVKTAEGLEYLHFKNLIHANINPHHVLLTNTNSQKITHFKHCRRVVEDLDEIFGVKLPQYRDARWLAQEIVKSHGQAKSTKECNVYAYSAPWLSVSYIPVLSARTIL